MKLRHYLSIVLALAVVAGVVGSVYLRDSGELGAMEVVKSSAKGVVEIHRGNEVIDVGSQPVSLEPQDVVVTNGKGLAELNLENESRSVRLQRNTRLRIRSSTVVEAQQGSILAEASNAPMEVLFDDVSTRFSSARFRLDRGFGTARAASFDGRVRLQSAGEPRVELTRLMQVEVAAGDLPTSAVPYRLKVSDAWDNEFLGDVVDLTRDLDPLVTGFARQLGNERPSLAYFAGLTTDDVSFMKKYLSRSVTDLLIAFTIADNDPDASFKETFKWAFRYLDDGASYGVAATLLDVEPNALVAQLEGLIVDSGVVAADGGAGGDASLVFGAPDASTSSSDSASTTTETESVSGGVEGESNEDVSDCSDVIDCGVQDVEDELPPGPGPGPSEEEDPPTNSLPGGDDGGLLNGDLLNK